MAQAARLSLRMQKELKLLLTDPPPGASFPFLSSDSDLSSSSSSLTSIDAFIEGPEGTVYAKGVFHIKIQIPERYPFQPPSVTFATPIYHPNIDTGGRICLDILNLPPKGAWQPSLNISTVLTSIGLLLSEPNPDDGLMCEASREYKYNRQVFDQKARSMTEKYAKAGADENTGGRQSILSGSKPSLMESERVDNGVKNEVIGHTSSEKMACGTSQKLSLELLGSNLKRECDGEPTEAPNQPVCLSNSVNPMETEGQRRESNGEVNEYKMACEKLSGTRRKLSLESFGQSQKRDADYKDKALPNTYTSALKPQCPMDCSESTSALQASYDQKNPHQDQDHISFSKRLSLSSKKLCQVDQRPSLRSSDTSRDIDINTQKLHITPQISLPQMYSSFPHNNSPKSPVIHQNNLQPVAEAKSVADSRYGITNTKCRKLSLVGKKLSLAAKISAPVEETDEKENMAPVHNLSLPHGSSYTLREGDYGLSNKDGSCQRPLPKSLMQLHGTNNDMKHNLKFSTDSSKSLSMSENLNCNLKLQSSYDHAGKLAGGSGIKETETEKSPVADAVIVLDSEDSDEERNESLRPKLLLARKRLGGKRRAKVS